MKPRGHPAADKRLRGRDVATVRRDSAVHGRELNVLSRDDRLLDDLGRRRLSNPPGDPVIRLLAALAEDADGGVAR